MSTCWGMKVPLKKSTHSTTHFNQTRMSGSKRSFSSSPVITISPYPFFSEKPRKDPLIQLIRDSINWPQKKWESDRHLLIKMCAATDSYQLCKVWGELYPDFYQSKPGKSDRWQKRLTFIECQIIKQNNEFIHALAAPGSNLPLWFNTSNVLR